jgi:hypothetical protein
MLNLSNKFFKKPSAKDEEQGKQTGHTSDDYNMGLEICQGDVVSRSGAEFCRKRFVLLCFIGAIILTGSGFAEAIVYIDLFCHYEAMGCFVLYS